jgi:hypothetical protein
MMQALQGRKKCDLYIIMNGPPLIESFDYDGMTEEVAHVANFLHILESFSLHIFYVDRNTHVFFWTGFMGGGHRQVWDLEEDESSPRMEKPELNTHKRALSFSSGDEHHTRA